MDTEIALATVVIFFCLSYTGTVLTWWGNRVGSETDDALSTPWLRVNASAGAGQAYFGKGPGQF